MGPLRWLAGLAAATALRVSPRMGTDGDQTTLKTVQPATSRRDVVLLGAGTTLAAALSTTPRASAAAVAVPSARRIEEGFVYVPVEGDVASKPSAAVAEVDATYGDAFADYLSRTLLTFEPASKRWWAAQTRLKKNDEELEGMLEAFTDSTRLSLARSWARDPDALLEALAARKEFGHSVKASRQLVAAFALIPPPFQPTNALDRLVAKTENRTVVSATLAPAFAGRVFQRSDVASKLVSSTASDDLDDDDDGTRFARVALVVDAPAFGPSKPAATASLRLKVVDLEDDDDDDAAASTETDNNATTPPTTRQRTVGYVPVDVTIDAPGAGYSSSQTPVRATLDGELIATCVLSEPGRASSKETETKAASSAVATGADKIQNAGASPRRSLLIGGDPLDALTWDARRRAWTFPGYAAQGFARQQGGSTTAQRRLFAPIEFDRTPTSADYWKIALCGAACASGAHAVLAPVELAKTKLQVSGNDVDATARSVKRAWDNYGFKGVFAGFDAVIVGFFLSGGAGFGLTEYLKSVLLAPHRSLEDDATNAAAATAAMDPAVAVVVASLVAAVVATVLVVPFESARVQAMTAAGKPPSVLASWRASIEEKDGDVVRALFGSLDALLVKDLVFAVVKFSAFDRVSALLFDTSPTLKESLAASLAVSLLSGSLAGVLAALASQPLDAAFTKLESMHGDAAPAVVHQGEEEPPLAPSEGPAAASSVFEMAATTGSSSRGGTEAAVGDESAAVPAESPAPRAVAPAAKRYGVFEALGDVYRDKGLLNGLYAGAGARALFAGALLALEFVIFEALKRGLHVSIADFAYSLDVLATATSVLPPPAALN